MIRATAGSRGLWLQRREPPETRTYAVVKSRRRGRSRPGELAAKRLRSRPWAPMETPPSTGSCGAGVPRPAGGWRWLEPARYSEGLFLLGYGQEVAV